MTHRHNKPRFETLFVMEQGAKEEADHTTNLALFWTGNPGSWLRVTHLGDAFAYFVDSGMTQRRIERAEASDLVKAEWREYDRAPADPTVAPAPRVARPAIRSQGVQLNPQKQLVVMELPNKDEVLMVGINLGHFDRNWSERMSRVDALELARILIEAAKGA